MPLHNMTLMPIPSHNQKSHDASPFDHLDLSNGMVPLITLLDSCDTDTNINDITWPKKLFCTSFWLSRLKQCIVAIDDAIGITWCQIASHDQKVIMHLLWSSWPIKWNGAIDDTVGHVTLIPASMAWHNQNSYVAHCCLDLVNTMVLLRASLAHNADASANCVK